MLMMSSTTVSEMSTLAVELAKSGHYPGWATVELELRDRGYPEAEHWLFNPSLRQRLNSICDLARARLSTETQLRLRL